jgi:hypothetical protein
MRAALGFVWSIISVSWLDYVAGFFGGLSIASLLSSAFSLDFGPVIGFVLSIYDNSIRFVLDPLGNAIEAVARLVAPYLNIDLSMSGVWRHGLVLIALYVQRHARNEWSDGRRWAPVFQVAAGFVTALAFALIGSWPKGLDGVARDLSDLYLFVGALTAYDFLFILFSAAFLREDFARKAGKEKADPPLRYAWSLASKAFARNASILALCAAVYFALLPTSAHGIAFPIALAVFLIGVAWCSRGLGRAAATDAGKAHDWREMYAAYRSYPAGKLGNAIVLSFVVGALLTVTGLAETRIGSLIELLA